MQYDDLCDLYRPRGGVRIVKFWRLRWAGYVASVDIIHIKSNNELHRSPGVIRTVKSRLRRTGYVVFFISPFIVPPVLLPTISTLSHLLMACRKCIQ